MTNFPESWHGQTDHAACNCVSRVPCLLDWPARCSPVSVLFQVAETSENMPMGHKAKLLGHRTRRKEEFYIHINSHA